MRSRWTLIRDGAFADVFGGALAADAWTSGLDRPGAWRTALTGFLDSLDSTTA